MNSEFQELGASQLIVVYWFFAFLLIVFNVWNIYNIPIVVVGIRHFLQAVKNKSPRVLRVNENLPVVSIIVPVKNEEQVVGRLLRALTKLTYPASKLEIIVVNDESNDQTGEICRHYASRCKQIRIFNRSTSSTKASALNFGLRHAHGEIVATFDADSVPEADVLLKVAQEFADDTVAAVQGRICSINAEENMLTKFLSYERFIQYEAHIRGKDQLHLFVSLAGTCQFIRRSVLEAVGGWNEQSLSEDIELSLRFTEQDHIIKYASEVRTWEENPNSFKDLVKQRARWYRGNIETSIRFGRLLKKLGLRRFDAEMTLFGTYLIVLCIVSYFVAAWTWFLPPGFLLTMILQFTSLLTVAIITLAGIGLMVVVRPFRLGNLRWLPFIYAYWGFQSFIATYAILRIVLRRPRRWNKSKRSGIVTAPDAQEIMAAH